jgi:N-acetylglucosaminyl-diphospho-decaprenol L-rhamnosyltransferase
MTVRDTHDVSIAIVNAGSRDDLLACLESLAGVDAEVVVLDNASDDGSVAAVHERFPGVRVIEQRRRAGFGENNNVIVRATSSRYVYLLNPDTTSDDWGLDRLVAHLDANPRVAALGPRLVYPDGRAQPSAWRFPTPAVAAYGLVTLGRRGVVESTGDETRDVDWNQAAALMIRRDALEEVGSFDEGFFMYSEETDLCLRLRQAGWRVQYFPSVTVVHHQPWAYEGVPERRINEMWRGRHRYWGKHHSAVGSRAAALLTGAQYALRGLIRARDRDFAARMRLHARNAIRVTGPGLRELAEDWNRAHPETSR